MDTVIGKEKKVRLLKQVAGCARDVTRFVIVDSMARGLTQFYLIS